MERADLGTCVTVRGDQPQATTLAITITHHLQHHLSTYLHTAEHDVSGYSSSSAMKNVSQCNSTLDEGDFYGLDHPRDTAIQIYLSIALGAVGFLTFCVRSMLLSSMLHMLTCAVSQAAMEGPLCRTQKAKQPDHCASGAPRQLFRLDGTIMENHRR